jgi:hypothetical protein
MRLLYPASWGIVPTTSPSRRVVIAGEPVPTATTTCLACLGSTHDTCAGNEIPICMLASGSNVPDNSRTRELLDAIRR